MAEPASDLSAEISALPIMQLPFAEGPSLLMPATDTATTVLVSAEGDIGIALDTSYAGQCVPVEDGWHVGGALFQRSSWRLI